MSGMASDVLLDAIGLLDDDLVEEARGWMDAPAVRLRVRYGAVWGVAAAAAVCVACTGTWWIATQQRKGSVGYPTVSAPSSLPTVAYERRDSLPPIASAFELGNMGGGIGETFGLYNVKNISDITSANPTRNNVESITELPVFANEPGLWTEQNHDLSMREETVYFDSVFRERTTAYGYSIYGDMTAYIDVWFQKDPSKPLTDQLLDYSFYRVMSYTYPEEDGESGWFQVMHPPKATGVLYPILSLKEATAELRAGRFYSYGFEQAVAQTCDILSVELVYLTEEYQTALQPYYLFYITDESWGLGGMEVDNPEDFFTVSPVYVPAISRDYLTMTEPIINNNK